MGTFKIIKTAAVLAVILSFQSCNYTPDQSGMVSIEEYESKVNEYKKLNDRQAAIIQQNLENDALINSIVEELRTLTTATNTLRLNVESGTASIGKQEEIKARLKELRQKLDEAGKMKVSDNTRDYIQTIRNLENIIDQKEKEIDALKIEIENKDKEIHQKSQTIKDQEQTILQQQKELIRKQAESWYSMGEELYNISKVLPVVKGKKDKNNMENTKIFILYRAKDCFEQAHSMGKNSINKINMIDSDITAL